MASFAKRPGGAKRTGTEGEGRSRRPRGISTRRFVLHLLIALGGYLRHGDYVTPNILDALPQSAAVGAARLAIVFAFAFTYPMMIFLCRMHIGWLGLGLGLGLG